MYYIGSAIIIFAMIFEYIGIFINSYTSINIDVYEFLVLKKLKKKNIIIPINHEYM